MPEQIIQKLMTKRCQLWPSCSCHRQWVHLQDRLGQDGWSFDEIAAVETTIFFMLSCVSAHCPDRKVRASATLQLLNPWWDRQRRGEELTKEWCQDRLRAQR